MPREIHLPVNIPYYSDVLHLTDEEFAGMSDQDWYDTFQRSQEIADIYRAVYGVGATGSLVENAASVGAIPIGASPSARPVQQSSGMMRQTEPVTQPQQQAAPQGYVDHTLPACENDPSHPVRKSDKTFQTPKMRAPAYGVNCTICKNSKGYPLSVGLVNA